MPFIQKSTELFLIRIVLAFNQRNMLFIYILIGILALFLIAALFVSRHFEYIEEIEIQKPANEIFEFIRFLKNQDTFSKWAQLDPAMHKSFQGTDGMVGAISSWESKHKNVGKGAQEIISIETNKINYELRFEKPFKATNYAYMEVKPLSGDHAKVYWGFKGSYAYPFQLIMKLMNLEKVLRHDLQTGLQNLKVKLNEQSQA